MDWRNLKKTRKHRQARKAKRSSHANVGVQIKKKVLGTKENRRSVFFVWSILLSIVVIGLILRIYHLQFYLGNGGSDAMFYIRGAVKFSDFGWFASSSARKGPVFTSLLSISFETFGSNFLASKLVSLVAGSLLPVFVFLLGLEFFNKKVGFLSALIVSINPLLILYSGLVFREALFSLLWTSCLYFTIVGFRGKTLYSIIGGVLFALSSVTMPIGIFAAIGFICFLFFQRVFGTKKTSMVEYKNLDVYFASAFLTLIPFLARNYLAYKEPFINWRVFGGFLSNFMWIYIGLMGLSIPYILLSRVFVYSLHRHFFSTLFHKNSKVVKISIIAITGILATFIVTYEILKGPGIFAYFVVGLAKLLESLLFPESLGFLFIFSFLVILYVIKSSHEATLGVFALIFCVPGLASGLTAHYLHYWDLSFDQVLTYSPTGPLNNRFRYVTPYIPLLAIFASYGIFLIVDKFILKILNKRNKKLGMNRLLKASITSFLILLIILQFYYANESVVARTQRTSSDLEKRYSSVLQWLSNQGSPVIYSFSSMLRDQYGSDKVVVLNGDESLMDIAKRASQEKIEYILVDIFGEYSETQLSLFLGGLTDDMSYYRLQSFQLFKSYKSWPMVQIYKISQVNLTQTALVVQHENWGQIWVDFLSKEYLVDSVDDKEDLSQSFFGDYNLIVLTEVKRALTNDELDVLREKVASGVILIVNGLSPAFMDLESNGYWVGATNFVEAPKDAKWNMRFTESAMNITTEIELDKNYALYTNSSYSSPTGLTEIGTDVVVYATRVEDGAAAIYAKPHVDGVVVFSGVRPSYAVTTNDYSTYINFIQSLLEKANDKTLFP